MGMYCEVSIAAPEDLERLSAETDQLSGLLQHATATANRISLEKAWHGLHYLLTGEAWGGNGPLAFLLAGGEQVDDEEESPLRWFSPDETIEIQQALSALSDDELWSRFDAGQLEQLQIYPCVWDEPEGDLKEEYVGYFHELKQLVAAASQTGKGLLVTLE